MSSTVKKRPNLGDILTRLNLIDDEQVHAALDLQQETGKLFGECLLQLGAIAEDDLGWALSSQLDLPFMNVTPEMPDPDLLARSPGTSCGGTSSFPSWSPRTPCRWCSRIPPTSSPWPA